MALSQNPSRAGRATITLLAIAALCLCWLIAAGEILLRRTAATIDEPGHLAAGISYWKNRHYAVSTGNFFFTQKWAAWPLASTPGLPDELTQRALQWNANRIGVRILRGAAPNLDLLLAPARRMTLVLCVATTLAVAGWAATLGGLPAGCFALALYATSPVVLAHGTLVTTDTGAALWFVVATFTYVRMLDQAHMSAAIATGGALGLLALSKFSIPAFLLSALLILSWHLWTRRATLRAVIVLLGLHAVALGIAWATLWLFFGFAQSAADVAPPTLDSTTLVGRIVGIISQCHLLPSAFAREFTNLPDMLSPRPGYLFGEFRLGGHLLFFPVAFLVKSTLALILAIAAWSRLRSSDRNHNPNTTASPSLSSAPLVLAALGYLVAAIGSGLNIGVRHILPLFAFAAMLGGLALARLFARAGLHRVAPSPLSP